MKAPILLVLALVFSLQFLRAQASNDDCALYTTICAGNTIHGSTVAATTQICTGCADGAAAVGTFCYTVNNSIWFAFTTNSIGGAASVTLNNLSCLIAAGMDTELEVAVISASSPCNSATYTVMGCSAPFAAGTTLNVAGLIPNTTYYIHVDGDQTGSGITQPAQCDFDISVSGPAVTPDVQETVTNTTCAGNTGQITITTVTPSTAPLQYSLNGGAFQASNNFAGLSQGNYMVVITDANGCSFQQAATVGLTGGPQDGTPAITNATGCNTNTGQIQINGITGGTIPYTYSLNGGPGQASNTFTNLPPGMYFVTVTDNTGCTFTYSNLIISSPSGITNVTVTVTQPSCSTPTGSITLTPTGGTPAINYIMNGGAPTTNNTFTGLAPGNYNFLLFDGFGCTWFISQVVITSPVQTVQPTVSISPINVSICQGDVVSFFATSANGGTAPTYNWLVNGGSVQNGTSPAFSSGTLNNGDVISCIVTSNDPCAIQNTASSNTVTATVVGQINPTVTLVPSTTQACEGDVLIVTTNQTGCPSGTGTYYWTVNGVLLDSTSTNTFAFTAAVNAEVTSQFMCDDACSNMVSSTPQTITVVQVDVDAGPDFVIGTGGSVQLLGSGNGTFSWSPTTTLSSGSIPTPVASPDQTTTYTLTVTSNGCTASDDATVVVTQPIEIVNTFTPNGDSYNDTWIINRIELFTSCQVTIYDRWGQRVFSSTGYRNENAWDGTYAGGKLPAAAYYYVIELNDELHPDPYIGWVTIIY